MDVKIICVVGLGYVGLPLAVHLSKHFSVIGFDVNEKRITELKGNNDCSKEVSVEELASSTIELTSDSTLIYKADFVIVCVPTPIDKHKKPDLSYVMSASELVGRNLSKNSVVVYESTVYPGVTEDICVPILEQNSCLKCGVDFKVGYSPERMNPGDKERTVDKITKIVSGMDEESLSVIDYVYSKITTTHKAPTIKVAEGAKVIENIQRDLNIALMNELNIIFDKMGIDTAEVLKAAGTKWNFHHYHPGLVGGHCFDKNSTVFLMNDNHHKIKKIGEYIDSLDCRKQVVNDVEIFYPCNVQILSYNLEKNKTLFKPVTMASKRKADDILNIKCVYNYNLEVTDKHPVIIYDDGLKVKFARDVKKGDKLVLNKILPSNKRNYVVDVLELLDEDMYDSVRVKIKDRKMSDFREIINKKIKEKKGNYYCWDYLPLKRYLEVEKKLGVSRKNIYLCTGRGHCLRRFPCIFKIDNDFIRLIGYYLSEGCITKDKSLRTRFTFHRKEKEYQSDVINILQKFGMKYSIYQDKTYQSTTIKVSSSFLGFLLRDVLKCGTNCYEMQIPQAFFDFNRKAKEELLKGLFRGDGGVTWYSKDRTYKKKGREYTHKNNSIEISYFTSSPILFQQVLLLLLNQNILPKLAKREGYLTLNGYEDVKKVESWFLGDKSRKIKSYLTNKQKKTKYLSSKKFKDYITIDVTSIDKKKTDYVYSMEVDETHTLITNNGIIAHNCIGVDPYYLTYKAEEHGYHPEVILAGRRINDNMHKFYAEKIVKMLQKNGMKEVLVLGLTFKPNVSDYRNTRVKHLIEVLQEYNITVSAYDPYLSREIIEEYFGAAYQDISVGLPGGKLVVLATPHDELLQLKKNVECSGLFFSLNDLS